MIRYIFATATIVFSAITMSGEEISMPAPEKSAGAPVMEALANRRSIRNFSEKELSRQQLGNILWTAKGQNRPDGRQTAPSCRNLQEIKLFVFDKNGVSEYMPSTHSLRHVVDGDYRNLVAAGQEFVNVAPVSIVMIADMSKFDKIDERALMMASADAGIVSENISVACAGLGFATVPRGMMKSAEIITLLNLPENHIAILNNPVGFEFETK